MRQLCLSVAVLAVTLLSLSSCTKENICQECSAFSNNGNEVYYSYVCHATDQDLQWNENRAEEEAEDHNGYWSCEIFVEESE